MVLGVHLIAYLCGSSISDGVFRFRSECDVPRVLLLLAVDERLSVERGGIHPQLLDVGVRVLLDCLAELAQLSFVLFWAVCECVKTIRRFLFCFENRPKNYQPRPRPIRENYKQRINKAIGININKTKNNRR